MYLCLHGMALNHRSDYMTQTNYCVDGHTMGHYTAQGFTLYVVPRAPIQSLKNSYDPALEIIAMYRPLMQKLQ
jgi:hypothetical protein